MTPVESNDNLLYLLTEKLDLLVNQMNEFWQDSDHINVSSAEWSFFIRAIAEQQTVSALARTSGITRQAAHKFYRSLAEKQLVTIKESPANARERLVVPTPRGERYYQQYISLQTELEDTIKQQLGAENVALLKQILRKDWTPESYRCSS